MFTPMRRDDRALSDGEALEILARAEYAIVSTIGKNGYPYGVPVSHVVLDGKVYFHCAAGVGAKVENIRHNPRVSVTAVGQTRLLPDQFSTLYESAIAFGTAREVDGDTKRAALVAIIDKYSPDFKIPGDKYINAMFDKTGIVEIALDHLTGKARK